ncbi:MAG: MarC family protein [Cyanobacteriota bacterium]|nr:MarC family protein [Cyanobacteriota bacterium]
MLHPMLNQSLHHVLQDAITLFVVIDPVGVIPIFIAVTYQQTSPDRQKTALLGVLISALILLLFITGGQYLLEVLGISLPAFRIAGGIVLFLLGIQMVLGKTTTSAVASPTDPGSPGEQAMAEASTTWAEVAVFPLAIPFIAGPGSMMTVVLLTDNAQFGLWDQLETTGAMLIILLITYLCLLAADSIQKCLGSTGVNIIIRVIGLLVAALAVETILGGIRGYFQPILPALTSSLTALG